MGTIYSRHELDTAIDPYGPMSGRNLVSIVSDDLGGDQLSEVDSYLMPGASRQSTPGHRHRPPEPPTYHHQPHGLYHPPTRPASYCDLHCQGKHEVTRRQSREASAH